MIIKNDTEIFREYKNVFIQRLPRYTVKLKGNKSWKTKKKPLSDIPIKAHLQGKYYVGVLGKWYPEFAILDMDNVTKEEAEKTRDMLKLESGVNSMLLSSESPNSYHTLIRPFHNNKPPTIRLLQDAFKMFGKQNNIEIYPQANRTIRLPFGYRQKCLDIDYIHLKDWKEQFYWFLKLDTFNLEDIPYSQPELDLKIENPGQPNTYKEGEYLLENGLQIKSSRNESQFKMLYYLWRKDIPQGIATDIVFLTIKEKHNGFSKDIRANPGECRKEIIRQAARIYNTYEFASIYPDETHNGYNGYITKGDIADIIRINPNLPRAKFLFNLIKFCYPRRYRNFINLHSDNLIAWSMRGYQKYLDELTKKEVVKRYDSYQVNRFSKSIKISWDFKDPDNAILDDNRAPISFEDTIRLSYAPEEFRELLIRAGSSREVAIIKTSRLFKT